LISSEDMPQAIDELYGSIKTRFRGDVLRLADTGYHDARRIWNGMFDRKPGLIAGCADVTDIQIAVKAAAQLGVTTAIRCGGHSLAGFSSCDGGLVIDLSRMRQVSVDPQRCTARFEGGCLLGSIDMATQKAGLVFPSGVVSHTGASGLVLGGGTGWLTRRFGLSCDNVTGFTLVTVDGSLVRTNARENTDLFWALRGGGGNFGVVTEFEVKLHPLKSVVLAEGLCPENKIRSLLKFWRDFMAEAPFDLKWNIDLRLAPRTDNVPAELRGKPVAGNSLVWTGDPQIGRPLLQRAVALCHPESVSTRSLPFLELQTMADSAFPHGRRYYSKSGYFKYLHDSTIENMIEGIGSIPSSDTQIELAYLGGAAGQVHTGETAFGDRSAPFIMNLLANWPDPSSDAAHIPWVRGLFEKLRPAMKPGVYVNFMSGDEQERVPEAYRERWDRIVAVKSHYDPNNFFRLNQNVRPQKLAAEKI
jgi:FAD binding domain/Berberine and berberine like